MTKTTQCPACQTRFKVSDAQLAAAGGRVRCGRCAHVFNAIDYLIAPPARPAEAPAQAEPAAPRHAAEPPAPVSQDIDDFELEVPDFDPAAANLAEMPLADSEDSGAPSLEDVQAFQQALNEALHQHPSVSAPIGNPFVEESTPPAAVAAVQPIEEEDLPAVLDTRRSPAAAQEAFAQEDTVAEPVPAFEPERPRFDPDIDLTPKRKRKNPLITVLVLLATLVGLLLLAGQLIYANRTQIAAQAPETRPVFERLCKKFGCNVPYPTDLEYIRTEWSELSFVPEHANLVQLSATLKNHAPYPQTFPMLEVTLKDADNQVLIRKVFTPQDYLKQEHRKLSRFDANGEEKIVMRFDVGKVHAQGYSLYWFYP